MLVVGRFAAAAGLTSYQAWAIARVLAAVLLGVACYLAIAHITARRRRRWLALATVTLSSGLGWYALGGAPSPLLEALPPLSLSLLQPGRPSSTGVPGRSVRHAVPPVCADCSNGVPRDDALLQASSPGTNLAATRSGSGPVARLAVWRARVRSWRCCCCADATPLAVQTPVPGRLAVILIAVALTTSC